MRNDPRAARQSAGLSGPPGWQLFAVYEDDDIVATGSLRVAARAAAAAEAGSAWVIAEAVAEKPGQHNPSLHTQLRAGLTARCQRANWIWRGFAA